MCELVSEIAYVTTLTLVLFLAFISSPFVFLVIFLFPTLLCWEVRVVVFTLECLQSTKGRNTIEKLLSSEAPPICDTHTHSFATLGSFFFLFCFFFFIWCLGVGVSLCGGLPIKFSKRVWKNHILMMKQNETQNAVWRCRNYEAGFSLLCNFWVSLLLMSFSIILELFTFLFVQLFRPKTSTRILAKVLPPKSSRN